MAFAGYLLKPSGLVFPNRFIAVETYTATPDQIQDSDSYVDANGLLHRNTLPHLRSKIEFNTPTLTDSDVNAMIGYFPTPKQFTLEYWNDKKRTYQTGIFYMPDPEFTINRIVGNKIYYNPIRIALIEY